MTHPHGFLLDLLAAHSSAEAHGGGLSPRLHDLLMARHAEGPGTHPLRARIRQDSPGQTAAPTMPRIENLSAQVSAPGRAHARR